MKSLAGSRGRAHWQGLGQQPQRILTRTFPVNRRLPFRRCRRRRSTTAKALSCARSPCDNRISNARRRKGPGGRSVLFLGNGRFADMLLGKWAARPCKETQLRHAYIPCAALNPPVQNRFRRPAAGATAGSCFGGLSIGERWGFSSPKPLARGPVPGPLLRFALIFASWAQFMVSAQTRVPSLVTRRPPSFAQKTFVPIVSSISTTSALAGSSSESQMNAISGLHAVRKS